MVSYDDVFLWPCHLATEILFPVTVVTKGLLVLPFRHLNYVASLGTRAWFIRGPEQQHGS